MNTILNDEDFAKSLKESYSIVFGVSMRMFRNQTDAEDNVQNTMLKAFKYRLQFKGQSKLSSWLCRIAINEGRMKLRRDKSRLQYTNFSDLPEEGKNSLNAIFEQQDKQPDAERTYIAKELVNLLFQDVSALRRGSLEKHIISGWEDHELAAQDGVAEPTIRSRWLKAKRLARLKNTELGLVNA